MAPVSFLNGKRAGGSENKRTGHKQVDETVAVHVRRVGIAAKPVPVFGKRFFSDMHQKNSLPCVSMQSSIYPELLAGRIKNRDITEDDLHPNDKGHELVADTVCHFLKKVLDHVDDPEEAVPNPEQIRFIWYPLSVLMFNCCSIRERRKNE